MVGAIRSEEGQDGALEAYGPDPCQNGDVLLPLSSYSGSTTISVANIKNVIKKYSPSARVNGLNKEKLLQLLEDIRKTNNITNADLCNKFADEIYLPKIVLKKADIPLSLRSQFIDLR